jgi:hypothetical protein
MARKALGAMNQDELGAEERRLVREQQKAMRARSVSDGKFATRLLAIQRELDKIATVRRFGQLTPAERDAVLELAKG